MNLPQSEMRPSISRTSAPNARDSMMFAAGVSDGIAMTQPQARLGGVRRRRAAGVARSRQGQRRGAERFGHRHGGREPARLERRGGVQSFIFYVEAAEPDTFAETARVNQRRHPFAEADRRRPGQHLFVSPHRVARATAALRDSASAGSGQVVSREQRRFAGGAQVFERRMGYDFRARLAGTLQMCDRRRHGRTV